MTPSEALNELLFDARLRERSLEELRLKLAEKPGPYRWDADPNRVASKLAGVRLVISLIEEYRKLAISDEGKYAA